MTLLAPALILLAAGLPAPQAPRASLRVVLLVDTSSSMTSHIPFTHGDRTLLTDATAALEAASRPEDARSVSTFGDGGASPLWDALDTALRSLDGAAGRRGIVVLTDGRTTANALPFADILERVRAAGVPVFFVCAERTKELKLADPSIRLRELAAASGGQYAAIKNYSGLSRPKPDEIRHAVHRAVDALRKTAAGGAI
jgi:Mg-chelatase subunit ChlD